MPSTIRQRLAKWVSALAVGAAITLSGEECRAFSLLDWTRNWERGFALGKWEGTVDGGYDFDNEETENPGEPTISITRNRYDERVGLHNRGFYFLDPRLVAGQAGVDFDFVQEADRSAGQHQSVDGTMFGYDFATWLFSEMPYTVTLFANRNQTTVNRDFGGRTEVTYTSLGGTGTVRENNFLTKYGYYYFTSQLDVRAEESHEETTQLGQTFKFAENRKTLSYEAGKGFQTADLRFRYDFTDVHDSGTSNLAYQSQHATLTYSLDFGPNLNRRWDSRINYMDRGGTSPNTFLWVDEALHIDHYDGLFTNYRYLLSRLESGGYTATSQSGFFEVNHRMYENLTHDFGLWGMLQKFPQGDIKSVAANLSTSYQRKIPLNGRFYITAGTRYQYDDNNLSSSEVSVVDEQHTVASSIGISAGFTLNNAFVVTLTIVIVDNRGGARLPVAVNVDYDIVQQGDRTEIVPLPTSLIIQPGDPLLVSYNYQVPAKATFLTNGRWISTGVGFSWIDFGYSHETSDQTQLGGKGAQEFLQKTSSDTIQVMIHHGWERLEASANAAYEKGDSTNYTYTTTRFGEYLNYRARWDIGLNLSANEAFTDYNPPKRSTQTRSVRISADRYAGNGGFISLFAGLRNEEDSKFPTETIIETGLRSRLIIGKLEFTPFFEWRDRSWGDIKTKSLRFEIRAVRHFF